MNNKPLPYLLAALVCERVIEGKDGAISIVRIADRIELQMDESPSGTYTAPRFTLDGVICLRSGPVTGEFTLKINLEKPSGQTKELQSLPVKLLGSDHGENFVLNFELKRECLPAVLSQ